MTGSDKQQSKLGPGTLVEGTEKDLPTFFALEKKLASRTYWPETEKEKVYGGNKMFYMVKIGEKTVGQMQYEKQEDNVIYLNVLAVDTEFQGKGIGKETMRQFLEMVPNASKIWLVTHPENKAIKLYESFGFKITERKEDYFGNGKPRVIMVKINKL